MSMLIRNFYLCLLATGVILLAHRGLAQSCSVIVTIAGNGANGFSGNGGAATAAELFYPSGIVADASGNLYIADYANNMVRRVSASGVISTFAGTGASAYSGDGGPATAAAIDGPTGVAIDDSGNIYVSVYFSGCVRKVNTSGVISTLAGTGTNGYSGDGGAATAAELYRPTGVAADASGNIYINDHYNSRIRKVNSSGIITTIAGTTTAGFSGDGGAATAAELNLPTGIAIDRSGNIYIADNNRVRMIGASGIINTIAGNGSIGFSGDGGPATAAEFSGVYALAVDASSNIFASDAANSRVREVNSSGIINTIAGNGTAGYTGDGGLATAAELDVPRGLAVDVDGNVFITDYSAAVVRKVTTGVPAIAPISGDSTLCAGLTTSLTDASPGGIWSSSTVAMATVSASGTVSAVTAGVVTITYSVTGICGTSIATATETIDPAPFSGVISGPSAVNEGDTVTLADTATGGVWTSSNTSVAIVVGEGKVRGISPGITIISYTVANSCGSVTAVDTITVLRSTLAPIIAEAPVISVFPNPAIGKLELQWAGQAPGGATIKITDITGKQVYSSTLGVMAAPGRYSFDISKLPGGVYLVNIESDSVSYSRKIVVEMK